MGRYGAGVPMRNRQCLCGFYKGLDRVWGRVYLVSVGKKVRAYRIGETNMATPKATPSTTSGPKIDGHKHDGEDNDCLRLAFGPFGDKLVHGSKLVYESATSDPKKRKPTDKLKADDWCFSFWTPANKAELVAFVNAKPDNVLALVGDALKSDARFKSWHENRGGSTTTRVSVNGADPKPLPNEIIALLKASGQDVKEVPKAK